jgi:hypothetical protein
MPAVTFARLSAYTLAHQFARLPARIDAALVVMLQLQRQLGGAIFSSDLSVR